MSEEKDKPIKDWKKHFEDTHIPHSSIRVFQRLYNKDAKKMLPGLRMVKEKTWIIIVALIIGGLIAGIFGTLTFIEATNAPTQLWDVCEPPAQLTLSSTGNPNGCVLHTITSYTVNGAIQVKNVTLPAGQLFYFNGTKSG